MKNLKKILVFMSLVLVAVTLVGCGKDDNSTKPVSYTLKDYMASSPTNWNPHTWETNADSVIAAYAEMGFVDMNVALDAQGKPIEGQYEWIYEMATAIDNITVESALNTEFATKWGLDDESENRVWEITLNPNAKWENGVPINADTYIKSMQLLLDPTMKNGRADTYATRDAAIAGADLYWKQGSKGVFSVLEIEKYNNCATVADLLATGDTFYFSPNSNPWVDWAFGDTMTNAVVGGYGAYFKSLDGSFDFYEKYKNFNGVVVTAENLAEYTADVANTALADLCINGYGWTLDEIVFYSLAADYQFPVVPWENVGLIKVDDYKLLYITKTEISTFDFFIFMGGNWIVYEQLYESGKTKVGDLWATNYGTSLATYKSYGPYKLTSFQVDKQFVLEKNENWYGYTDGNHENQFMTTRLEIDIIPDHATALMRFEQGTIDSIGLTVDDLEKYRFSEYLLQTETSYTTRYIFNTNLDHLKQLEVNAGDGANKRVLYYDDFRKAMSLAINRAKLATEGTAGHKPAYGLLNSLYYYNPGSDPGSVYRYTDYAKEAIIRLYDITYGPGQTYETLDDAYAAVTGFDVEGARVLFQEAYEQAVADGNYTAGQKIFLNCFALAAAVQPQDVIQQNLLNQFIRTAMTGTGFEASQFEIKFGNSTTRYTDVQEGKVEMIRGAWGGAYFYPFDAIGCYVNPAVNGGIHESSGFDPESESFEIVWDWDNDPATPEDGKTKTYYEWWLSITTGGEFNIAQNDYQWSRKLKILSEIEYHVLNDYHCIIVATQTDVSLYSMKIEYITYQYSPLYAYGGIRYMTYNYTDAEWDDFVKANGGQLNYT